MTRDTIGEFEHQVLLSILRLDGEAYSVSVVLDLEEATGREISQAAVFLTLRRLEAKGLVASRMGAGRGDDGTGRERRYFRLTRAGMKRLRSTRALLLRLWDRVADQLDEA
jgi:DNA-binding PadR family transcriptional regulator